MPSKNDISEAGTDDTSRKALRFISEQAAVRLDQLARYMKVDVEGIDVLVQKLEAIPLVLNKVFFDDEPRWLWLNRRGAALAGTGLSHRCYPPDLMSLRHRYTINEVRLHLEDLEPKGKWLSETVIQGRRPKGAQIPDGVFEVGGERHAIEVELSPKEKRHLRRVLKENSDRYDAVIYFSGPLTVRMLRREKDTGAWPKLLIRELPGDLSKRPARGRRDARRNPTDEEVAILRLIAEQGTVRVDQFGRLLSIEPSQVDELLSRLSEANFLKVEPGLRGEPDWLALTFAGNRLSGVPLEYFRPGIGLIAERFAINELRIYFAVRAPSAVWTSRRLLKRRYGKNAQVPHALVESDGKRIGVNIRMSATNATTLVPRTDLQNNSYDAVIFFCATKRARLGMERLQEQHCWSKVVIRDMPKADAYAAEPRPVELMVESLLGV